MPLNQQDAEKVQDWLNSKGAKATCPACGQSTWSIGDVIAPPVMQGGNISMGGPSVPMVQVICNHCANISLYAAVPMGVVGGDNA